MTRVIFLGEPHVGKTTLIQQMVESEFSGPVPATTQASFYQLARSDVEIQLWDTAGMEKYRAINRIYYREAAVGILVFDVTNKRTFDNLRDWITDFRNEAPDDAKLIIVGNKIDTMESLVVSEETAKNLGDTEDCQVFYTSAVTGAGVPEMTDAVADLSKQIKPTHIPTEAEVIHTVNVTEEKKSCSC